jgi:hypothetical protein
MTEIDPVSDAEDADDDGALAWGLPIAVPGHKALWPGTPHPPTRAPPGILTPGIRLPGILWGKGHTMVGSDAGILKRTLPSICSKIDLLRLGTKRQFIVKRLSRETLPSPSRKQEDLE